MNKFFYNSLRLFSSYQRDLASSHPQYKALTKMWLTLFFLGILLLPRMQAQVGAALNFDGSNDYVSTPGTLLASGSSYTKEAWIKLNMTTGNFNIISSLGNPFWFQQGKLAVGHNASYAFLQESGTTTANTWTHVAVTYNASTTTLKLYKNGVEVGSSTNAPNYTGNPIQLGAHNTSAFFAGGIDEVRIWNRALPQCEIQNNMNCELGGGQTGLLAYYKFNQGTSNSNNAGVTSLTDASGNNNTGTLTNFGLTGATSNWVATGGVTTGTTCTTPSVSIAASPSGAILSGSSVTFTATPTNEGTTPTYQWQKNNVNVGTNSTTYTDVTLANGDVIKCILTSNGNVTCPTTTTATSNSVTMTVTFPAGAALNFDGSDDYVNLGTTLGNFGTSNFTYEVYFKTSSTAKMNIFSKRQGGGCGNFSALFLNPGGNLVFEITEDGCNNYAGILTTATYNDNNWHHVAAVRSGQNIYLYVDGTLAASGAGSTTTSLSSSTPFLLGFNDGGGFPFSGSLDEARIWSRALPQCEIQNNMNCELGGGQTGLLAYYKFNQGTSNSNNAGITSLTDDSGNNNTGTLTNFGLTGATSNWVATGGVTTGTTCTPYILTWTGTTSTDWSTATNWSPNCVPSIIDNVIIPTTANKPMLPANQTIANLTLTGTNKIMLGNSTLCVNAITGGSATSYIVTDGTGSLIIKALSTSTPTTFPIGASETSYDPLSIRPTNSVDFTAKVKTTTVAEDFSGSITNFNKTAKRQWDITPTGSTGSTVLTLTNGGTTYTPTTAKVGHYTSSNVWEELDATHSNGTWTATTTSFSPFGVGDAGGFSAVLSVEWLSFTGYNKGGVNILNWQIANEVNNKGFQVERRQVTGDSWDVLGFKAANNKATTYEFTDNAPLSTSYYRLRQIDNDGTETLSKVISVQNTPSGGQGLKVYPNPVSNVLTIETTETSDFQIFNLLGQQVLNGKATQRIDVSALPQGTYFLKAGAEQVKFIKK